jgi:hypothetical protein
LLVPSGKAVVGQAAVNREDIPLVSQGGMQPEPLHVPSSCESSSMYPKLMIRQFVIVTASTENSRRKSTW